MKENWSEHIWNLLTQAEKLGATAYIFKTLCEHAREGGTYRLLIYDRLGFGSTGYLVLYPDGMYISNNFSLYKI